MKTTNWIGKPSPDHLTPKSGQVLIQWKCRPPLHQECEGKHWKPHHYVEQGAAVAQVKSMNMCQSFFDYRVKP